jgi:hypothetical protein
VSSNTVNSGDAYVRYDDRTKSWVLGTSLIEQKLTFANGKFSLTQLQNRMDKREFVSKSSASDEFRLTLDGTPITGTSGHWVVKNSDTTVLSQGEIQLVVSLKNDVLQVDKYYVVYPQTGIVRQWVKFQNISSHSLVVSDPYFLSDRLQVDEASTLTLRYMTGGGYFTGSQILKQVALSPTYARTFDSTDKVERIEVGGSSYGDSMSWGSGVYM